MHNHLLEIYDAEEFAGPNPISVTGLGIIKGPENTHYYVIETSDKIQPNGRPITQLALRAHYGGDHIDQVKESVCTVGIAIMKSDCKLDAGKVYGFDDFIFWKVGKLHPKNGIEK